MSTKPKTGIMIIQKKMVFQFISSKEERKSIVKHQARCFTKPCFETVVCHFPIALKGVRKVRSAIHLGVSESPSDTSALFCTTRINIVSIYLYLNLFIYLFIDVPIYLFIYLIIDLYIYVFIYLVTYINMSMYMYIYIYIYLFIFLSIFLFAYLLFCLFIYLFIYVCVYVFIHLV